MSCRDRSLLHHFGLQPDALYWGKAHQDYARQLRDAIHSRRFIAVIGGFGSGKSELVRQASISAKTIYVNNPDKEGLRIGQVVRAMVLGLSAEAPRRDALSCSIQLSRIIGELVIVGGQEVCVVIENAHRMHARALLALKDMRESMIYSGQAFLFSIILVGQERLRGKLERFGEVRYRTRTLDLDTGGWMNYAERVDYLAAIYGPVIAPGVRSRLAALYTTPLELDHAIEPNLRLLRDAGLTVLDGDTLTIPLAEQRLALSASQQDLAQMTGIARSTISEIERGTKTAPALRRRVQQALDELAAKRRGPLSKAS